MFGYATRDLKLGQVRPMKRIILPFILVIFSGCASAPKQDHWPQEIPPYSYYLAAYQADTLNSERQSLEAYLDWVKNYYYGNALYSRGWLKVIEEAKEFVDDPIEGEAIEEKLYIVGKKVSAEWSKSKSAQTINTKLLGIWGVSLQEALDRGEALEFLDRVMADVEALLSQQVSINDIDKYRYYQQSEDFFY